MKKFLSLFCALTAGFAVSAQQFELKVQNTLPLQRNDEVVEIKWADLVGWYPGLDTNNLKITDADGKELVFQIEYKGRTLPSNLLVLTDLKPSSTTVIRFLKSKRPEFSPRVFGRYVPERLDDFAWENDRAAFRMYGTALESRPSENAHGIDVWSKRTKELIVDRWYRTGDYHKDHGDGLDYYKVGFTLGAGDIAPFVNDSIWFSGNYVRYKVLDNGPIRVSFRLEYDAWNVDGRKVSVTKSISMDAGSHLNRAEIRYHSSDGKDIPVVIGLVKRDEAGIVILDEKNGVMAYEEPEHGNDGIMRLACVSLSPARMEVRKGHLLTHRVAARHTAVEYYFGASWSKAGYFSSVNEWTEYLKVFRQRVLNPVKLSK